MPANATISTPATAEKLSNIDHPYAAKRPPIDSDYFETFNRDNVRFNPPGVNTATGRVSNLFESLIPIVPSAGILIEF